VLESSTHYSKLVMAIFLAGAAVAIYLLCAKRMRARASLAATATLLLGAGVMTSLTAALTVAWDHHVQMLAYPAALLVGMAAAALEAAMRSAAGRIGAVAGLAGLVAVLGGVNPARASAPIWTWYRGVHSRTAAALELVRTERLASATDVSYAHLGQNDEEAHAAFIGGGWTLSCSRFHQYPWTPAPALRSLLACVDKHRPQLLLVTSSLSDRAGAPSAWHTFVVEAQQLASTYYRLVYHLRHAGGTVAVWKRQ
jgi:hypothetical protein